MWFYLLLLLIALLVLRFSTKKREIPGPSYFFTFSLFLRHIFGYIVPGQRLSITKNFTLKYGLTISVYNVIGVRTIWALEPECVKHILKTNFNNYIKGASFRKMFNDLLGDGIFNTNGDSWKSQRKVASHLFKTLNLKTFMLNVFVKHGHVVCDILDKKSKSGETFDLQNLLLKYTLDTIGEIAFGVDLESLHHPEEPISNAFTFVVESSANRFRNPFWSLFVDKSFNNELEKLNQFAYDIIRERRKDSNLHQKEDILSRYLTSQDVSDKTLRDQVFNFLLAGRDTTGQTSLWFIYLISTHPEAEEQLVKEIKSNIGNSEFPDYESLQKMKYLHACVQETLRLYPAVPFDVKYAINDDVLPNGTKVKAGDSVGWSAWMTGHSELLWDSPNEFRPTRWLDGSLDNIHPFQHVPFQAGPRICLGEKMALLEVKTIATMLISRYAFTIVGPIVPDSRVTICALNEFKVAVSRR
eukprot:TRINITY_DN11816_c0_g1_i1.p1 TRINITY_DN11816_c0_g1~~TRINITY_DN11816_c0_g1_i1.p1  ORF type:complete len:470 (+),score=66.38 TRINITY_DN11816_c0_g1_i1:57-1466(+)